METLNFLFPGVSHSTKESALRSAKFDVDLAATLIVEDKVKDVQGKQSSMQQVASSRGVNLPLVPNSDLNLLNLARSVSHDKHSMIHITDNLPNTTSPSFYSLKDGNCCPHALGLSIAFLCDMMPSKKAEHISFATSMRDLILNFLAINWESRSLLTDLPWHQIVYFAHNLSIPDTERVQYPDWGCTANDHWIGWTREANDLYLHTSEMLALCEMLRKSDISLPITFRLWRKEKKRIYRSGTIPENVDNLSYVFDLVHEGEYDTNRAHWKLMKTGTALNGEASSSQASIRGASSKTRVRDADSDYLPTSKKSGKRVKR